MLIAPWNEIWIGGFEMSTIKMNAIFSEIAKERSHQDQVWGGPEHDDLHNMRDWACYIMLYLGRAVGKEANWGRNESFVRTMFIKIAALCVAAIQSIDRRKK